MPSLCDIDIEVARGWCCVCRRNVDAVPEDFGTGERTAFGPHVDLVLVCAECREPVDRPRPHISEEFYATPD